MEEKKSGTSPLNTMSMNYPTDFWNDSCSIDELTKSVADGAVGATTNPVIVGQVLKQEMHLWKDRIRGLIDENPAASEADIAWLLNEEMAAAGAKILMPVFEKHGGKKGRISIQTNAQYYRNAKAMADQAEHFNGLAPNMQVKLPATAAGIDAVEEATYRGVSLNATVSFTLPQAIAVAEAVERGLARREKEGKDTASMSPVCTLMVGRLDDWLKVAAAKADTLIDPGYFEWCGVAVMKRAYEIFGKRGYRTRLLAAAYRNQFHWSELVGGDVILTIPYPWQVKINKSDIPVVPRMDIPVDPKIVDTLLKKVPDFRRAYEPDGMKPAEFDSFGSTARTLRQFLKGYQDLVAVIRDFMVPDPDK